MQEGTPHDEKGLLLYALDHMTLKEVTRKKIAFDEEGSQ